MGIKVGDIGLPGTTVKKAKTALEQHHKLNLDLVHFRSTDKLLRKTCISRIRGKFPSDEERLMFEGKIMDATASTKTFWDVERTIRMSLTSISYKMGRPNNTTLCDLLGGLGAEERNFVILSKEENNLSNICISRGVQDIEKAICRIRLQFDSVKMALQAQDVTLRMEVLDIEKEAIKKEIETANERILLQNSDMYENKKEWPLCCGHMYCSVCLNRLQSQRTTEGILCVDVFPGEEVATYPVYIPTECAFCRGSLTWAHKIYF